MLRPRKRAASRTREPEEEHGRRCQAAQETALPAADEARDRQRDGSDAIGEPRQQPQPTMAPYPTNIAANAGCRTSTKSNPSARTPRRAMTPPNRPTSAST